MVSKFDRLALALRGIVVHHDLLIVQQVDRGIHLVLGDQMLIFTSVHLSLQIASGIHLLEHLHLLAAFQLPIRRFLASLLVHAVPQPAVYVVVLRLED